jgi:hypothetical protein
MKDKLRFVMNKWFLFGAGIVLGAFVILAIRFVAYKPGQVHYHANFAVYINNQREQFKGTQYYQEVALCSTNDISNPLERTHMHEEVNGVIHVHDHAVTWSQFFENLGWYVGPDFVQTADGTMYKADETNKLHILLNNQDYTGLTSIANTVIKDRDRLLVSFGNADDNELQTEYKTVPNNAKQYDEAKDPASCAGSEKITVNDRLHHLF